MSAAPEMLSGRVESQRADGANRLDEALRTLSERAQAFARLDLNQKLDLLNASRARTADVAEDWARAGHQAKGLPADHGEEWLVGPVPTMRNLRLLAESLERIRKGRRPVDDKQIRQRADGRTEVSVFPTSNLDAALFTGFTVTQVMASGLTPDDVKHRAGAFYRQPAPQGGVSLILGAGNVSSIPPMDALYKMFAEGRVCLVKMNPVNEWAGPFLEAALSPFIDRGFLRVVYGGGDEGRYLVQHEAVGDVHITGSNLTHDLIVWGPPGAERDRRMAANEPLLKKPITSELGNVSPVCIVPFEYEPAELAFMARNVAAMITNNASFNCNAAKMLITSEGWTQRSDFLRRIEAALSETPTRRAYYPGAFERYARLIAGRDSVHKVGAADDERLPWTVISDVDPTRTDDPLFKTEPFCAVLSETRLPAREPAAFLTEATTFMNERLWGTLNAAILVPPKLEGSTEVGGALDRSIDQLRYGTVAINHWPAVAYAATSPAWGGHPSSTLADVQSGLGWVHNTYLLDGIEKTVLRGPLRVFPKPVWFGDHSRAGEIGRRLVDLERSPSWLKIPRIALSAVRG